MRGTLVKSAVWGCVCVASAAVVLLAGLGWGLLVWSVATAAFLFFVVDIPETVDTPSRQSTASGVTWIRRAG